MGNLRLPILLAGITACQVASATDNPTYDAVVAGKQCSESRGEISCQYRVGLSLYFEIVAIGVRDAGVTFYKVDVDGDFYATFGLLHGCVIVKPGRKLQRSGVLSLAFVSPANGKVYQTWEECQRRG